jgi:hypothetical protein
MLQKAGHPPPRERRIFSDQHPRSARGGDPVFAMVAPRAQSGLMAGVGRPEFLFLGLEGVSGSGSVALRLQDLSLQLVQPRFYHLPLWIMRWPEEAIPT